MGACRSSLEKCLNPNFTPIKYQTFRLKNGKRSHLHENCAHLRGLKIGKEWGPHADRLLCCIQCSFNFINEGHNGMILYILDRFDAALAPSQPIDIPLLAWFDNIIDLFFNARLHQCLYNRIIESKHQTEQVHICRTFWLIRSTLQQMIPVQVARTALQELQGDHVQHWCATYMKPRLESAFREKWIQTRCKLTLNLVKAQISG